MRKWSIFAVMVTTVMIWGGLVAPSADAHKSSCHGGHGRGNYRTDWDYDYWHGHGRDPYYYWGASPRGGYGRYDDGGWRLYYSW